MKARTQNWPNCGAIPQKHPSSKHSYQLSGPEKSNPPEAMQQQSPCRSLLSERPSARTCPMQGLGFRSFRSWGTIGLGRVEDLWMSFTLQRECFWLWLSLSALSTQSLLKALSCPAQQPSRTSKACSRSCGEPSDPSDTETASKDFQRSP